MKYCPVCGIALCKTCGGHEPGSYQSNLVSQAYEAHEEAGAEKPKICDCYE